MCVVTLAVLQRAGQQLRAKLCLSAHSGWCWLGEQALHLDMLQAHMSLFHVATTLTGGQDPTRTGWLDPMPVGGADARARLSRLLRQMCRDLVARVVLDRWGPWGFASGGV
jgi:hypothetical protein